MSRRTKENKSAVRGEKNPGGSDMKRVYLILALVGVIGIAAVGYSVASNAMGEAVTQPVPIEGSDDPARLVAIAEGVERGDPDASVTLLEFADYQCPGCGSFAMQVKPMVDMTYVDPGQVKFVFYDFPLEQHQNSFIAHRSARCAGDQDLYWEFHDALFGNQRSWSASGNPIPLFLDYARDLGADVSSFESCVKSDRHAEVVSANALLGQQLGVSSTPTLMLSEGSGMATRISSPDFESVQRAIDGALEP